jgi:1-phosphofructokinase
MILSVTLNPAVDKALEVPGFHVGAHARARVMSVLAAGKGVNVARGLARLGGTAVAAGFVGRDEERVFAGSLAEDGIRAEFTAVAGRTRTNTTILDPDARTTTHLREWGFEVSAADLSAIRTRLQELLSRGDADTVVFAGSLPQGMEPGHFASLIEACADRDARVVVDTNGPALEAAVATGAVDTLKPNLLELGQVLGRDVPAGEGPQAAAELLDRVKTVLLTLGEQGAWLVREGAAVGRACPLAGGELRNTVGCGDAFLAGWLHGEQVSDDPADALCWAVAAGAASAMSESTVGYALDDAQALLPRCTDLRPG